MPLGYFYPKPGLTGQVTINRAKNMPDLCRLSLRALAHCSIVLYMYLTLSHDLMPVVEVVSGPFPARHQQLSCQQTIPGSLADNILHRTHSRLDLN
jgi:hypothetical protein